MFRWRRALHLLFWKQIHTAGASGDVLGAVVVGVLVVFSFSGLEVKSVAMVDKLIITLATLTAGSMVTSALDA